MDRQGRLRTIIQHIKLVEDNCNKLAMKLQDEDFRFALKLIKAGRIHDASKFDNYEFDYLGNFEKEKPPEFFKALEMHHRKNPHHPEHWGVFDGIKKMPNLYLAEMVCDCVARAQEFGTDARKWFYEEATKKYGFTLEDECGKSIVKYLDLLLNKPFNAGSGN
jgi:hypothetical protein